MFVTEVWMDYEGFSYGGGKRYGGFGQVYGGEDDATANERRMREDAERYAGMSPDALESELIARAGALRAEGKLDTAKLREFARGVAPFMSAAEQQRLRQLIDMLDRV